MMNVRRFLRDLGREWSKDNVSRHAAALAYYTVFSLPSFLLLTISVAGFFLNEDTVSRELFRQIGRLMGPTTADLLQATFLRPRSPGSNLLFTIISTCTLIFAALGAFSELRSSLHDILRRKGEKYDAGFTGTVRGYLVSFGVLLLTATLILSSVIAGTALAFFQERISQWVQLSPSVLTALDLSVTYAGLCLLFFLLYTLLSGVRLPASAVLAGSVIATALFLGVRALVTLYISTANIGSQYGVAASVIVLLLWIYASAHVFLLGAEIIDGVVREQRRR